MIALWLALASATEVSRHAIVVGSDVGAGTDAPLRFAEQDALRMAEVLRTVGSVRNENMVLLQTPTADELRTALASVSRRIASESEQQTVLTFFYSGHADSAGLRTAQTTLAHDELTTLLADIPVDVRVVLLDACQSGALTRRKGAQQAEPFPIRPNDRMGSEGLAVIASSSGGEDAQESDWLGGGIFTHHLLTGLRGAADQSADGRVTVTEAYRYAYAQTLRSTSLTDVVQHPSYAFDLRGRDDLVLTWPETEATSRLVLDDPGQWWVFERGPVGGLVAEVDVDEPVGLALRDGGYLVRHRQGLRLWQGILSVDGTTRVARGDLSRVAAGTSVRKGWSPARTSTAVAVGAGLTRELVPGAGTVGLGSVSVAVDFPDLTVGVQAALSVDRVKQPQFVSRTQRASLGLLAVRKVDWQPVVPFFGAGVFLDAIAQQFETAGEAPARWALAPRIGPRVGVEVPAGAWSVVVQSGVDATWQSVYSPALQQAASNALVQPSLQIMVARHVR